MTDQKPETPPLLTMTQERFDLIANSRVDAFVTWQGELVREVRAQAAALRTAEQERARLEHILATSNESWFGRVGQALPDADHE